MAESYSVRAVLSCVDKGFSSGLKAASKTTDSLVSKFKSGFSFGAWAAAGASAFRTVTGGITGLAKGIVQSGMEFESTMSTVKAISGATEDEMDRLTNLAKEMGATTKFTATESAEALKYMGMAGWDAGQMISGLPGILNLAAAGETDLGTTSDIVTDGLSAFGLKAEDAAHFSDALAAAVTSTNTDVLMMGETFKYVGPVCGSLGTSMEDTAIAAGLMAGQGVKASQAGTSLRRGLQNLIAPTKPVAAAMEKYGVAIATTADGQLDLLGTIKNVRSALSGMSDVERTAAVSAIFGANAQTGWNAIIKTSDEEFQRVTESIYGCEGAAQKMADIKMDNLAGDVTLFQSAWDGVRQTLYDMEKGPLRSVVQMATEAMTALNDCIANGTSFASAISQVDGLGTALKGIGGAAGVASAAIGAISISDFLKGSGALDKVDLNLRYISNSFSTLKNKVGSFSFDKFAKKGRSSFAKMWKQSRDLGKAFDTFGGKIALSMDAISPKLSDAGLKIWDSFYGVGRKISTSGSDLAKNMRESFKGATDAVSEVISRVSTIAAPFKDVISKVGGVVTSVGGKMTSGLTSMIGLAMKLLAPTALAGAALAGLGLLYSQFGSQIDSIIQMVSEKGPQIISNFANGITGKLPSLIAAGAQMLSGLMNAISANIPAIIQAGVSVVGALVQGVGNSLGTLIPAAIGLVSSLVSGILSALPQLITTGMNLLLALVQGIVNNLPLIINSAMAAIMAFIDGAASSMPDIIGTAVQIVKTLVDGIVKNLPTIVANGSKIVGAFISCIEKNFPSIVSAGWDIIVSLGKGLFGAIKSIIPGVVSDGVGSAFGDVLDSVSEKLKEFAGFIKDHADTIAKVIKVIPKLLAGYLAFKAVSKVAGPVAKFGGAIAKLASSGISKLSGKLFGVSKSTDVISKSSGGMLESAKAFAAVGAGILMVSAGFALLAESAIRLSKAGGPAIAIMAGLVAAVAGITIGMTALAKSLTAASPKKLEQISKVMLSIGGAISAVVLSLAALSLAVVPLASLGTTAVAPLAAFGVVVAGLAVVFSMVGEKLKASVVGIVAFAAAISVMALAMAPLAATGTEGAIAMAAFGVVVAGLVAVFSIFGTALNVAIPGMVGLAIAAVGVGAGMRLATPFIEALPPLIKQIGDTASQVAGALADAISKIVDAFSGLVSTIADAVSQIAESVGGTLCQIFQTAGDAISEVVGTIGDGISGIIDSISGGFATVLDSIAGIFDSIGGAALNAGKGFNEMATGIEKIVGLNLLDMSASLGAVATGIGAITAVSGGMADAGTGMMNIGAGLMFISGFAAQAAEKLALIPQAVIPVSAAVPALVAAFSQLTVSVGGFVASSAGLSTFAAQMFVLVGVLGVASSAAASFGASMTGAGAGLAFVAGSARSAGASVKTIAVSAALAQGAVSGLRAALGTLKGGLSGIGAAAQGAAVKMIAAFSSSAAKAKTAGKQIGSSLQTGVSSGLSKTVSVTRQAFTNIINVFRSGASTAKASGIQIGNNVLTGIRTGMIKIPVIARTAMTAFASAISSGSSRAVSTARRAASSIVTAFRSAHSGAYSAGRYIGQGLVSGLSSTLGQVRSMAARIAAAADKAIRAKAKIASPSKVTTKDGKYIGLGLVVGLKKMFGAVYSAGVGLAAMASKGIMDEAEIHSPSRKATKHGVNVGQGFANGLLASFKTVQSAAKGLAKTAFASLKSITAGKKGGFSSTASKVASSYEKSLTAQMNAQLSSMKKKLNGAIKKNKSVKKALNAAYEQYSKYLKDAVDKAISKTKYRLEKLGDAYQEKYEGFRDRLREYGDMFTSDSYGYVSMRNFDELTKQIDTLGTNLEKLKGWGLSQSFMEELAGLDTASALTVTNELLSMGADAAKNYGKSYDKAMSKAASVSDKFYQSYFDTAVNKELSSLQSDLNKIGKNAMDGFVKGMNSKAKSLTGSSKKLALSIVSTFKKYLKIHSPSKVFAMLGRYIGVGLINGLERIAGKVQSATENLVTLPDIRVPTPALATPGGSLVYSGVSEGLTQVPESEYVIIVPVELDGKEVARVTAPYTQRELNKLESRASRKRGVL